MEMWISILLSEVNKMFVMAGALRVCGYWGDNKRIVDKINGGKKSRFVDEGQSDWSTPYLILASLLSPVVWLSTLIL